MLRDGVSAVVINGRAAPRWPSRRLGRGKWWLTMRTLGAMGTGGLAGERMGGNPKEKRGSRQGPCPFGAACALLEIHSSIRTSGSAVLDRISSD